MKKIFLFLLSIGYGYSQNVSEPTDLKGVKVGFVGVWVHYEKALNDKVTIDSQIGFVGGVFQGRGDSDLDFAFTSIISLEPRYYYNFERRNGLGKETKNNSANYFSLDASYIPNLFTSSNNSSISVAESFVLGPKYGLRRSISDLLTFEFAFGIGYQWTKDGFDNGLVPLLDLRVDFNF